MRPLLYNTLLTLAAPPAAAYLAVRSKYRPLLGRFRPDVPPMAARPVWIHACSVGEVAVARPLVASLKARWPDNPILLTVSTVTGRDAAASMKDAATAWFPFDHPASVRAFLDAANPRTLLLIETEVWPNVISRARSRNIPVILVNGRISEKHFGRYRRHRALMESAFAGLSAACVQNDRYARRFESLGVSPDCVTVTGNTKFDGVSASVDPAVQDQLRLACGIPHDAPVLVFGSTRPGDERLAAACWNRLREGIEGLRLIVVPRHIDRADEAAACFETPVLRRTRARSCEAPHDARVILVDTMGELVAFYSLADVAVVGGSFFPGVEGHNPIEPATLGVPTVFGPHMKNFVDPAEALIAADGALQVDSPDALLPALERLFRDRDRAAEMARRGCAAVEANQGALERTLDVVAKFL